MSGKNTWISISSATIFMQVSGQWQRVRPGQRVTGTIADDLKSNFKLVDADAEEIAELKKWLDENEVSYQPNTGVVKLRKYKADKVAEQGAEEPAEDAVEEGDAPEEEGSGE